MTRSAAQADFAEEPRLKLKLASSLSSSGGGLPAASSERESKLELRRPADFDELVAPLEEAGDGRRPLQLNGPGLEWCLAAFAEDPEGFAACAERALERWEEGRSRRPLGLLCQMVRGGEHLAGPAVDGDGGSSETRQAPALEDRPLTREGKKRRLAAVDLKVFYLPTLIRSEKAEAAARGEEFDPEVVGCMNGCEELGDGFVRWDRALGYPDDHGQVLCVHCANERLDELEGGE